MSWLDACHGGTMSSTSARDADQEFPQYACCNVSQIVYDGAALGLSACVSRTASAVRGCSLSRTKRDTFAFGRDGSRSRRAFEVHVYSTDRLGRVY